VASRSTGGPATRPGCDTRVVDRLCLRSRFGVSRWRVASVVCRRPILASANYTRSSPTIVELLACSTSSSMFGGVDVRFAWPWPFVEMDSAVRQDRSFASVDQSNHFVVFTHRSVERDFGLRPTPLCIQSNVKRLHAGVL